MGRIIAGIDPMLPIVPVLIVTPTGKPAGAPKEVIKPWMNCIAKR
jgi:hypothetical protein